MLELKYKRTLNSKTFLVDEATKTKQTEIHFSPIHHVDWETGQLEDNDYTIVPEQNWEFEYAVKKNLFRAYFNDSTDIDNATLAGFEILNKNGITRWINYKLFGAAPTGHSYQDNKFKFENVFAGIDLEYVVTPERLKENIIVKEYTENFSFTFTLKISEGIRLEQQPDGSIFFIDTETEEKLWEISRPYAEDSFLEPIRTEEVEYVLSKQVYNEVEYDSITVNLLADVSGLTFPVVIDPTTTIQLDSTTGKDCHISSRYQDDNYATSTSFLVGVYGTSYVNRGLLFFDISSVSGYVSSAIMSIYCIAIGETTTNKVINAYRITQDWDETTVTWNNAPSYNQVQVYASVEITKQGSAFDFDITELVRDFFYGSYQNYGLLLASSDETKANTQRTFASSNHTTQNYRPKLTVVYNDSPSAPIITFPNGGEELDVEHAITWNPAVDSTAEEIDSQQTNTGYTGNNNRVGQTFTVRNAGYIVAIETGAYHPVGEATLKITAVDENELPDESIVYTTEHFSIPSGIGSSGPFVKVPITTPFSVPVGTKLAWFVYSDSGNNIYMHTGSNYYLDGNYIQKPSTGDWTVYTPRDCYFRVYMQGTPQNKLRYQLQLSINDGLTWSHILSELTDEGITSLTYDFSAIPDTNQAKIRVRAWDGWGFGDWDVSETFSISHGKTYAKVDGAYVKAKVYVKQGGIYIEVKPQRKVDGVYQKI